MKGDEPGPGRSLPSALGGLVSRIPSDEVRDSAAAVVGHAERDLAVLFRGKNVAVLGPCGSGKTTLWDFLERGTVERAADSPRAATADVTPRGPARRRELHLAIHPGSDVPGSTAFFPDWRGCFTQADIVFYLFDAHSIRTNPDYRHRVSQDGLAMKEWGTTGKRIYLIGTHRDEDPLSTKCSDAEYAATIVGLQVIRVLRALLEARSPVVGELSNDLAAGNLIKRALDVQ